MIHIGSVAKRTDTGELFKVLCNCRHSMPRNHTLRYVQDNPATFTEASPEEVVAYNSGKRNVR